MIKLVNGKLEDLARYIQKSEKDIYFWGAGVILQTCISQFISEYNISHYVAGCVDSDMRKWGKLVSVSDRKIVIMSPVSFYERIDKKNNILVIITSSYFYEILDELDCKFNEYEMTCVIMPIVYLENRVSDSGIIEMKKEQRIPKKIHYCWFGKREMSEKSVRCIATWKRYCPDYELICWDESNVDFESSPWLKEMYEKHNWAFVSDYVRAEVLYKYGGIYFDTDVELLRGLDDLMGLTAFGSFEGWPVLNPGGGCGSIPGFWLWNEIMELKNAVMQNQNDLEKNLASGYYDTMPLIKHGFKLDGKMQTLDGFTVLPSEYFHPYDYMSNSLRKTANTYGVHHFNWSWANELMESGVKNRDYSKVMLRMNNI